MVPLTEATIEWDAPGGRKIARWDTVVVNRLLTDWIAPATRDATEAAATRAIDDFLADHAEARAAESLSSENPKHPPTA
jgi:hypothetical protein